MLDDAAVAVVCDGVGGSRGGAIASSLAVELALAHLKDGKLHWPALLEQITERMRKEAQADQGLVEMATTFTAAKIAPQRVEFAHIGDSRIYHLRGQGIAQRTEDQSEVAALVKQGILPKRMARGYARRSVLLSAVSPRGDYELTSGQFDVSTGDRVLLITDGVYRSLTKRAIRDFSLQAATVTAFISTLESAVVEAGPQDDATAVCIGL